MVQGQTSVEFLAFPPITREQLKAYADASGDFNPIHLEDRIAIQVGLPGIIAHGMLVAAFISERARSFIENWRASLFRAEFPAAAPEYVLSRFYVRFKAMTFLWDTLSVGGVMEESGGAVILDLQAKNQKGEVTTLGQAHFELKSQRRVDEERSKSVSVSGNSPFGRGENPLSISHF